MRRWEYKKIALYETSRRGDEIDLLCDAGEEGWELVSVLPNGVAYLKREVIACAPEMAQHRQDETEEAEPPVVATTASNGGSVSVKPKYRDSVTGETWSGRGRMATWLKRKQDAGEDIEEYLV